MVARLSLGGCGMMEESHCGDGKAPWCWERPHPCHIGCPFPGMSPVGAPGCRAGGLGIPNPSVCGAVIPRQMEQGAGIEHSWGSGWGASVPPQSRGIQRRVQSSLRVPGESSSHCTLHPGRAASREYSGHSLSNSTAKNFSKTEFPLFLWQAKSRVFVGVLCPQQSPREIPQVSQGFAVPGMESQGFIKKLSLESCRWAGNGNPEGHRLEKKKKTKKKQKKKPKKSPKSPVLPSVSVPKGLGIPVPRPPSERSGVEVQGHSQRTYLKEISLELLSCSPVASQSYFSHTGQGTVIKILIYQWQSLEHIPVPALKSQPLGDPSHPEGTFLPHWVGWELIHWKKQNLLEKTELIYQKNWSVVLSEELKVYPGCVLGVTGVYPGCILGVTGVCPVCTQGCILGVSWV
ncbi:uncharacterized protein LOC121355093 [Pyrgilauda ruficollis]|uniref:uncharacterized protein LOC121355093 n=1 Tax=Pyrgilauda ruficollis TaxID=221976 RepID=UPI001B877E12|nr:uncharacterized protein LOC121355093 [Pyrgilauda ruficollis]